jgi:hypothetical protein
MSLAAIEAALIESAAHLVEPTLRRRVPLAIQEREQKGEAT